MRAAGNERRGLQCDGSAPFLRCTYLAATSAASLAPRGCGNGRQCALVSPDTAAATAAHLMVFGGRSAAQRRARHRRASSMRRSRICRGMRAAARAGHELRGSALAESRGALRQRRRRAARWWPSMPSRAAIRSAEERALSISDLQRAAVYLQRRRRLAAGRAGSTPPRRAPRCTRCAPPCRARAPAPVASQGDFAQGSDALRSDVPAH